MVSRKSSLLRLLASPAAGVDPVCGCVCLVAELLLPPTTATQPVPAANQPIHPFCVILPFSSPFSPQHSLFTLFLFFRYSPLWFSVDCIFLQKSSDKRQISLRRLRFLPEPLNRLNFTTPAISVSPDKSLSLDSSYFLYR